MFWEKLWAILTVTSIWELLVIFVAKIIEVAIGTLRNILIVKGYKTPGFFLALVEIMLWVFIASQVITGLAESPMKGIAYGIGFAAGVYFGSMLESALAVGKIQIQAITAADKAKALADKLRELGCGVTTVEAMGRVDKKCILLIYTNRRGSQKIVNEILLLEPQAMVALDDVSNMVGGYIRSGKSIIK
jgi:uncharacterized protein YebE (UPF0316 family)